MASDPRGVAVRAVRESLRTQEALLSREPMGEILRAAKAIAESLRDGGKLLAFGNGGSAAQASHIVAELVGRFQRERAPLPALSLCENQSALTAIANDYGFEEIFARQVRAVGAPPDVAIGISTSGRSVNVLAGLQAARQASITTIALTGPQGTQLHSQADVCIAVQGAGVARIQEAHLLVAHVLCELVERELR
jgi:D-sedoheptulose 7-phosphate isomerase